MSAVVVGVTLAVGAVGLLGLAVLVGWRLRAPLVVLDVRLEDLAKGLKRLHYATLDCQVRCTCRCRREDLDADMSGRAVGPSAADEQLMGEFPTDDDAPVGER